MKLGGLLVLVLLTSGCTGITANRMFEDSDSGFVMLTGDAEGIRAYNDGLNGLLTNGRGNPDIKSAYWQSREQETQAKVFRFRALNTKGGKNE